jgi:hypothetical protein
MVAKISGAISFIKELWDEFGISFEHISERIRTAIDMIIGRFERLIDRARQAINLVKQAGGGAIDKVKGATGSILDTARGIVPFADGGIVTSPTLGLVGEAGPEAIIPLNKAGAFGGLTINIYGDVSGEEIIDKVGDGIMRKIKQELRL